MPTIIDPITDRRYTCFLVNKFNSASLDFDSTQDLHDFVYSGSYPKPIIVVTDEDKSFSLLIEAKIKMDDFTKTGMVYISAQGISGLEMVDIVQRIRDGQYYKRQRRGFFRKLKTILEKEKEVETNKIAKKKIYEEIDRDFKQAEENYAKKTKSLI